MSRKASPTINPAFSVDNVPEETVQRRPESPIPEPILDVVEDPDVCVTPRISQDWVRSPKADVSFPIVEGPPSPGHTPPLVPRTPAVHETPSASDTTPTDQILDPPPHHLEERPVLSSPLASDKENDDDDDDDNDTSGEGEEVRHCSPIRVHTTSGVTMLVLGVLLVLAYFFFPDSHFSGIPALIWFAELMILIIGRYAAAILVSGGLWALDHLVGTDNTLYYLTVMHGQLVTVFHFMGAYTSWRLMLSNCTGMGVTCGDDVLEGSTAGWFMSRTILLVALAGVAMCCKLLAVQVMANAYHQGNHLGLIKRALWEEWTINCLLRKPRKHRRVHVIDGGKGQTKTMADWPVDVEELESNNFSKEKMHKMLAYTRKRKYTSLSSTLARTPKTVSNDKEAKIVAEHIFRNVYCKGQPFNRAGQVVRIPLGARLSKQDFASFIPAHLLEKAFSVWDRFDEGSVTYPRVRRRVLQIYRNRRNLSRTIKHANTTVEKLGTAMNSIAFLVIAIIAILVYDVGFERTVVGISTLVILLGFFLGNTLKLFVESALFLFVQHPFDCGDRVEIDNENMVVEQMNLFTSVFRRWDGLVLSISNAVLARKKVYNFRRSVAIWGAYDINISRDTPIHLLDSIQTELNAWCKQNQNWGAADYGIQGVTNNNNMHVTYWCEARYNMVDLGVKWQMRNAFTKQLLVQLDKYGVEYTPLTQPVRLEDDTVHVADGFPRDGRRPMATPGMREAFGLTG
eukprot:TRINITY_DN3778_c0_g1_i1.p1 TRINITY_DN3778_c0_g1~~TRINITY_DN3778_c0_g1_i1.p1  ORF type:complete len:739 (+),score=103.58 TRINITY_DN3778_c0_g1_i1:207-2423(+)